MDNIRISTHSFNTVTGDLEGNLQKIKDRILADKEAGADLSIFPETAISGYMCGALWDSEDFVSKQYAGPQKIKSYMSTIGYEGTVIVGFVDYRGMKKNGFPHLKNAAAIITAEGSIRKYHKQLLASSDHHEDKKYFEPGDETKSFVLDLPNGKKVCAGILICEDAWFNDHERNIPKELVEDHGAEILICINQSYFYYGKQEKRYNNFKTIAKLNKVPIITVNSVGVGDILKNLVIFDGGAMVFCPAGNMIECAERFQETNLKFSLEEGKVYTNLVEFQPPNKFDEILEALIFEQREFFRLCHIDKAQVHVSGGLDSAITAAVVAQAMGKENTVLITNPSHLNTTSYDYAEALCKNLGIKMWENPIQSIFDEFMRQHGMAFDWEELSDTGKSTVQATLRTVQGLAASHHFKSGIVATGNHTEIVLGWSSFHDIGSIGVHAILGDMTKMELYQFAKYLNEEYFQREVIPKELYNGEFKPAAELPDAMEDPIDYKVQSGICALLIRERKSRDDILDAFDDSREDRFESKSLLSKDLFPDKDYLWSLTPEEFEKEVDFAFNKMKRSVYKAAQGAPIVIISPRSRGFSNRETLINEYNEKI
jgi:NAD+ synthase (glutamine-hydrolysing)